MKRRTLKPGQVTAGDNVLVSTDQHLPPVAAVVLSVGPIIQSMYGPIMQDIRYRSAINEGGATLWDRGGSEVFATNR